MRHSDDKPDEKWEPAGGGRDTGVLTVGRKRKHRPEPHLNHERWLVSYADFITLLFAFFTMLYAMSSVDAKKFNSMVQSMQAAFEMRGYNGRVGDDALGPESKAGQPTEVVVPPADKGLDQGKDGGVGKEADLAQLHQELNRRLSRQIGQNLVDIERDPRGLVISIREAGSFTTGSAGLSPTAMDLMAQIGATLKDVRNAVRIEGHTDDVPIHTAQFRSNWELSTARATTVVAFMLDQRYVEPARLSAAGYAEYHPRAANTSDATRARNRRVDIVILNPSTRTAEEPTRTDKPS